MKPDATLHATRAAARMAMAAATLLLACSAQAQQRSAYLPVKVPSHAKSYYEAYAGVGDLSVRLIASGNLIRFSYRVVDAATAKVLGDRNATPYLFGQRSHALLHVPSMDMVGQLRQGGQPEVGRMYWMVFSNKGNLIRAGDRVSVMVGTFHIDGLMVE